ncbi:hypothetical protein BRAO375_740018 [Bradyrhizobium sp. ORS 375]|nr:hypothetical protein BRAO375_740018 [Bradyrhizobium sp. ORS 375]
MTFDMEALATAQRESAEAEAQTAPSLAVCGTDGPHYADLQTAIELGLSDERTSVHISYYDDQRCGRRAQEVAGEVAARGIKYVIGHFSTPAAIAASRVYGDQGIVFLAPGTSAPDLCTPTSTTTVQLFGTDDEQSECLAVAAAELARPTLLLSQTGTYGARLAARLVRRLTPCCRRLTALYFSEDPPRRLPVTVETGDVLMILGPQDFAKKLFAGALRSASPGQILMSDDCFASCLFPETDLASRCSVAFLEPQSGMLIDQQTSKLRQRARQVLGRSAGPYFETSYIAARALAVAWRNVGYHDPEAVLQYILKQSWQSPFGLLSFSAGRRLQGHRWRMIPAQSISGR